MHGQFTRERDSLHSVVLHDGKPRSARGSRPERFEQLRASLGSPEPAVLLRPVLSELTPLHATTPVGGGLLFRFGTLQRRKNDWW